MKIHVFIQQEDGKINRNSVEAIAGAQQLAGETNGEVTAIVFGSGNTELTNYDLKGVIQVRNPELDQFNALMYCAALEQVYRAESPDVVVLSHTYEARDWVPRLSARLDIPLITDCISFKMEDSLVFTRQIYQGKINTDIRAELPAILSFQSGAFRPDAAVEGSCSVEDFSADLSSVGSSIRTGEKFKESKGAVDLSRAEIIVSIGRGVGKEENMPVIQELADALGAELGSSRPVVDYGWLPHERQVGSSGQTVAPKLYLAIGISGAIQHQVGMKGSDHIIAINKDANAPIFEIADIGVVADLFEVVPKLTEAIRSHKG